MEYVNDAYTESFSLYPITPEEFFLRCKVNESIKKVRPKTLSLQTL